MPNPYPWACQQRTHYNYQIQHQPHCRLCSHPGRQFLFQRRRSWGDVVEEELGVWRTRIWRPHQCENKSGSPVIKALIEDLTSFRSLLPSRAVSPSISQTQLKRFPLRTHRDHLQRRHHPLQHPLCQVLINDAADAIWEPKYLMQFGGVGGIITSNLGAEVSDEFIPEGS